MNLLKNVFKKYHLKDYNFTLIITVMLLSTIGILAVGSALPSAQSKQIIGVVLGLIVMVVISLVDFNWILGFQWFIYALNLFLLLWVEFFGAEYNNAKRWIDLKVITLQPSDFTKIFMVLFFAKFLMDHEQEIKEPKTILKALLLIAPSLYLILTQPNLSNTICLAGIFFVLMYLGGLHYKIVGTVLAVGASGIILFLMFLSYAESANLPFLKGYQLERIMAWRYPEEYATTTGLQQQNSIMAIGSGQLNGKGLNNNSFTSVKNGNFLIESETDFIFAIIGEELGFVGCCLVIFLLLLIIIQCIRIGMKAQNLSGQIICGGVAAMIGIQSFINMGVATGVLPNTGLSLPFVSAGLTSIVCFYMSIGFVLNVGLQPKKY
ncbi:MAG: FtsW/RodA/SpoVE family cell cycle protein [Methanobrevibacter sp.]|nr:FtsW/RodA/SpoVE family cell cycle protein [Methanobrevibacter sp.]